MKLLDACEQFLTHCEIEKKLSPLTVRAYRGDLDQFTTRVGINHNMHDFSETWIENAVQNWLKDPTLKSTTIKRRIACVKVFVRWLFRRKIISSNFLERLHLEIRLPRRLPRNLQTNEIKTLIAITPENIFDDLNKKINSIWSRRDWDKLTARLAIEVLTLTGMRVGELVKIKLRDLDPVLQQIRILGKGNRERHVSFPDKITTARLKVYRKHATLRFGAESHEHFC